MLVLNNNQIQNISGGGNSIYAYIDVKIKETPIEYLPILIQLSNDCVTKKWDAGRFATELMNAGIDSSLISIEPEFELNISSKTYE